MAKDTSNLKVYLRGTDLSTSLQSTAIDQVGEEVDVTVFASQIRSLQPTFARATLAHAGLYEDGPNSLGEVFRQARAGTDEPITVAPDGVTVGNRAFIVVAEVATLTLPEDMAPGQVARASLRATANVAIPPLGRIHVNGSVAADSQGTALQLGALAAGQQLLATVHLIALTGTPSATFFLESDNGVGFATPTIQATSAVQTARGSVLLRKAGPVTDDWWRVRWDHSGTGSFTAIIALGLAG